MLIFTTLRHAAQANRELEGEEWTEEVREDANVKLRNRLMLQSYAADWKARNSTIWQSAFCLIHDDLTPGESLS